MSTTNDPEGTIPFSDAIDMTANWRQHLASSGQPFVTQSFLIPIVSFTNILLYNPDAEGVNAYIGLENPTDLTTAKLILVPVVNGQDVPVIPNPNGKANSIQSNVYDLASSCPPFCIVDSALNGCEILKTDLKVDQF